MAASKLQEVKVGFNDIVVDGIPSVELILEVDEEAKSLKEPTPAMWVSIYIAHQFNSGKLMADVQEFVKTGQFVR